MLDYVPITIFASKKGQYSCLYIFIMRQSTCSNLPARSLWNHHIKKKKDQLKTILFVSVSCYFCSRSTLKTKAPFFCFHRDDHGHHEHESYYGDRDTESLVKVRTTLFLILHPQRSNINSTWANKSSGWYSDFKITLSWFTAFWDNLMWNSMLFRQWKHLFPKFLLRSTSQPML